MELLLVVRILELEIRVSGEYAHPVREQLVVGGTAQLEPDVPVAEIEQHGAGRKDGAMMFLETSDQDRPFDNRELVDEIRKKSSNGRLKCPTLSLAQIGERESAPMRP